MPDECVDFSKRRVRVLKKPKKRLVKEIFNARLARAQALPQGDGWIAAAYWNNETGRVISSLTTTWEVPPEPTTQSGQLIYLFNGITCYGADNAILQPVLQWGVSADGGGSYWAVASWYVHTSGDAFKTPLVRVNVADRLTGAIALSGTSGSAFSYNCEFLGLPGTSLHVLNVPELTWVSHTLEAYGAASCTDYPATTRSIFRNINIKAGDTVPEARWSTETRVKSCGQRVEVVNDSAAGGQVDIYYGSGA
jgi:hypothetical protein